MGKGNTNNLKVPTSEQAREYGSKGGKASAENKKQRKLFQQAFQDLLNGTYTIENKSLGGYKAVASAMIQQALNGNVKAYVAIRDTVGEKPTDKIEQSGENKLDVNIRVVE